MYSVGNGRHSISIYNAANHWKQKAERLKEELDLIDDEADDGKACIESR